ncbi:hypothetical protein D3C78_51830 [compost metagenome]
MLLNERINQYLMICGVQSGILNNHNDDMLNNIDYSQEELDDLSRSIKRLEQQSIFADALQIAGAVVTATQLAKYSNYVFTGYESFSSFVIETSNNNDILDSFFSSLPNSNLATISDLVDGASIIADIFDGVSTLGLGLVATYAAKEAGKLANSELEIKYDQLKIKNKNKNKIHTLLKNEKHIIKRKEQLKQLTQQYPNLLF